ncbi:MAG: hypothetical protein JXA11_03455 [Phycisphaerae bacterium]|nr:hypothetical protein [Phycisphaerae bacterium]
MNENDAKLLDVLQGHLPLVARPWAAVGEIVSLSEDDVLHRVAHWRDTGILRRIGGVFDAARLGYRQTLLAFAVEENRLDAAAEMVAEHPGVSHCYGRRDEYNLWATLAVSPESTLGLEATAQRLAEGMKAKAFLNLPSPRRFKLSVRFGRNPGGNPSDAVDTESSRKVLSCTDEQRRAVRALQMDLPLEDRPFDTLARQEGFSSGEELLVHAADLQAAGVLRRYAAVAHHVAVGAKSNVLVVWRVPEEKAELAGGAAAKHEAVSHCYLRKTADGWPFNLYTMIHGASAEDCAKTIAAIAANLGQREYRELWTTKEYKKQPVKLFGAEESRWDAKE